MSLVKWWNENLICFWCHMISSCSAIDFLQMFKRVWDFRERQTETDELDDSWLIGTDRPACPITSHEIIWQHNPNLEHKYVYRINSWSLLFWSSNNSFLIKIHHFSYLLVLYTLQEVPLDDIHCWDCEGFYWSIIYLFIVFICGDLATSLPTDVRFSLTFLLHCLHFNCVSSEKLSPAGVECMKTLNLQWWCLCVWIKKNNI